MSRLFDLVDPECGKNMEVGQEVDLTPECHKERDNAGIRKILREAGSGDDYPNSGDKIKLSYKSFKGDEIHEEYFIEPKGWTEREYEVCRGEILSGLELAILTMKKGEHSEIYLTPEYGYGKAGAPPDIPTDTPVIFEVKLHDIQCPDLSPANDRSILKKTLVRGTGRHEPNDGSMMTVYMKGWYTGANGEDIVFDDKEVCFTYCEGSYEKHDVPQFVVSNIHHWKMTEKARLFLKSQHAYGEAGNPILGIPPNTDITYIIELKDFEKKKNLWEMNNQEKLDICLKHKEKGTFYFKEKNMDLAYKFYQRIVDIVGNDLCMEGEEEKRRQDILHIGLLNLAQVCLNKDYFREAKDVCDKALAMEGRENNLKALYRRGLASFNLKEWEVAEADFKKFLKLQPSNTTVIQYVKECQQKTKETAGQEKDLAKKMTSGFGIGPDDRLINERGMNDIDEGSNGVAQGTTTPEEEQAAFGETIYEREMGGNNHPMET